MLWVRASASCLIPSTVNWLLINLHTNIHSRRVSDSPRQSGVSNRCQPWRQHVSEYRVCSCMGVFFTRGGINLCSPGPTGQSVELLHQSTHSAPTCSSTNRLFSTQSISLLQLWNLWAQTARPAYQNILRTLFSFSASARHFPPLDVMLLAARLEHRNTVTTPFNQ